MQRSQRHDRVLCGALGYFQIDHKSETLANHDLRYIWAQFGHVPKYRIHIPTSIAWFVAFILEMLTWFTGGSATIDRGSVKDGMRTHYSNNDKAIRILGYVPEVDLAEGMRRSCDGYKKHLAGKAACVQNGHAAHVQNGVSRKFR